MNPIDLRHYEIPTEIAIAADEVRLWAAKNGYKDWMLMGIADRMLVEKLERENARLRELLKGADATLDDFGLGKYGSPLRSAIADTLSNS